MELQAIDTTDAVSVKPIVYKGQVVITTNQLAGSYDTDVNNIQANFKRNINKFEEIKHYFLLTGNELREFKNQLTDSQSPIVNKFTSNLYLWTHRGANRHCKILDTDRAWEQFDILEENYFGSNKYKPQCMEDVIIYQMQQMKFMKQQLNQINNNALRANTIAKEARKEVKTIKEVVSLDTTSWRRDTQNIINKIAIKQGGCSHINLLRKESYDLLNKRFGVSLERRLSNKCKNLALEGVSKSKIARFNNLDVIGEDKKLIEGYVAIVKDMAIKYGI